MRRDVAGLTKNGQHYTTRSEIEELRSYLLLLAEDQDSIVELLQLPTASPQSIATALQSTAASLRRRAKRLCESPPHAYDSNTGVRYEEGDRA